MENTKTNWNLSDIYTSIDDLKIKKDIADLKKRSSAFEKKYKNKILNGELNADVFLKAIEEYENILMQSVKPDYFASLLFSTDMKDKQKGAFMQKMEEEFVNITKPILFFELEIAKMPAQKLNEFIKFEKFKKYSHYLKRIFETKKHNLSEPEEKIAQELNIVGRSAFSRLFEEITARKNFKVKIGGKIQEMNEAATLALLHSPKRDVRKTATIALTEGFKDNLFYITFIYNTLLQNGKITDNLRKYEYPGHARHLSEETDKKVVDVLTEEVSDKYDLVVRYYNLKRKILKVDKLYDYDRYAPLPQKEIKISFPEARKIVLDSFGEFSESMAQIAEEFFEKNWIDAEIKSGKRGGAFCSYVTPDIHPYIMTNYAGHFKDVMTIAHELGHGVHAQLAKSKGYLSFSSSLALAETASVFGEMLVFEKELKSLKSDKEKLALYGSKIEEIFATVFRQNCMYEFEKEVHKIRRERGELTEDELSDIWLAQNKKMFGNSVVLTDDYKVWWSYIGHFIQSPFYVYAYVFGELLTLSLYNMYKKEGKSFEKKYLEILSAGGSESPKKILKDIGVDISKKEFWQGGLNIIEDMIKEAENLYKKTSNK